MCRDAQDGQRQSVGSTEVWRQLHTDVRSRLLKFGNSIGNVLCDMGTCREKVGKDDDLFSTLRRAARQAFWNGRFGQFQKSHFDVVYARGLQFGNPLGQAAHFIVGGLAAAAMRDNKKMAISHNQP